MTPASRSEAAPLRWPTEEERPLGTVLRTAVATLADDFPRFFALAAAWLMLAGAVLLVARLHATLNVLLVALVPITGAIARVAACTVRGRPARLHQARDGLRHRWPVVMAVGGLQVTVSAVAWLNIDLGVAVASPPLLLAAAVSANVLVAVSAVATCVWPLFYDPARDALALGQIVRLAVGVLVRRPGRLALLLLLLAVLLAVSLQTLVGALVAVPLALLIAAYLVIPTADQLRAPDA